MDNKTLAQEQIPSSASPPGNHGDDVDMEEDNHRTTASTHGHRGQPQPQPLFATDDKIFAQDGSENMYYPGIIRICRFKNGAWQYKVHYHGWNSRWDRWLTGDLILRDTEQNRKFLQESGLLPTSKKEEAKIVTKSGTGAGGQSTVVAAAAPAAATSVGTVKRKRGNDERATKKRRGATGSNSSSLVQSLYEEFCELPLTLKTVLMDEMAKVTRQSNPYDDCANRRKAPVRLVHQLPAPVTIAQVLKHFAKKRSQTAVADTQASPEGENNSTKTESVASPTPQDVEDFCQGLSNLFEESLPKFLLYPQERPQYEAIMIQQSSSSSSSQDNNKPLAEIYGCEFLLRLYVRLPVLMASNTQNVQIVGPLLADLMVLMQKNRQACFKGTYREPRPDEWMDIEKSLYHHHNNIHHHHHPHCSVTENNDPHGTIAAAAAKASMDVCDY